ncbi:MarR family transcriptional regulator [Balneolales bacterium ANBcel1]|nr:MarR family transcriptional regulator [Balneolales bacterium ANBcel1]
MYEANQTSTSRFRNNRHKAVANILYTYNTVTSRLQRILGEKNLTLQQYNLLRILARLHPEPACNFAIRNQMFDSRSDVTRIVDRLIKEGLAVRKHCCQDRRKVDINITEKGLSLLEEMDRLNDKMDGIVSSLTHQELEELNRILEKVRSST